MTVCAKTENSKIPTKGQILNTKNKKRKWTIYQSTNISGDALSLLTNDP